MPKYEVVVLRTRTEQASVVVEARDEDAAEEAALSLFKARGHQAAWVDVDTDWDIEECTNLDEEE